MAKDATLEILSGLQEKRKEEIFSFMNPQIYNIEDMDPKVCMASLEFSGCYVFKSSKKIDTFHPGMIFIDGEKAEAPVLVNDEMFGQLLGVRVRKYLHKYDSSYIIKYTGGVDVDGNELPDISFELKTCNDNYTCICRAHTIIYKI